MPIHFWKENRVCVDIYLYIDYLDDSCLVKKKLRDIIVGDNGIRERVEEFWYFILFITGTLIFLSSNKLVYYICVVIMQKFPLVSSLITSWSFDRKCYINKVWIVLIRYWGACVPFSDSQFVCEREREKERAIVLFSLCFMCVWNVTDMEIVSLYTQAIYNSSVSSSHSDIASKTDSPSLYIFIMKIINGGIYSCNSNDGCDVNKWDSCSHKHLTQYCENISKVYLRNSFSLIKNSDFKVMVMKMSSRVTSLWMCQTSGSFFIWCNRSVFCVVSWCNVYICKWG